MAARSREQQRADAGGGRRGRLRGLEAGRFWIFTHPEEFDTLVERRARMLTGHTPPELPKLGVTALATSTTPAEDPGFRRGPLN